jgi:microcystin-dependent protein
MASQPFISEIQIFAFNFAPKNWVQCNGQTLAIAQNQALFSLLGTTYGGNGVTTFQLPNLMSRTPNSFGASSGNGNYNQGQVGGEESHALTLSEMPPHNHFMQASSNDADLPNADGNLLAKKGSSPLYNNTQNNTAMSPATIAFAGGGQGHQNIQPYLVLNYCIALVGIFPSRN